MTTPAILVIDDAETWLRLMRRLLAHSGYEVHTALTCAEGINLAARLKPDCILLDFHLPDGDARSVCAALNSSEITNGIPVVIISGDPAVESSACDECRAAAFLDKGTDCVKDIPATIAGILLKKRSSLPLRP